MTYKSEIYNNDNDSEDEEVHPLITYDISDSESKEEVEDDNKEDDQHIFTQFDDKNMQHYLCENIHRPRSPATVQD